MTAGLFSRGRYALLILALGASCGYSPSVKTGALRCGTGASCPEGFECAAQFCWKPNLFGVWSFVAPSTRHVVCGTDLNKTEDWTNRGEMFELVEGAVGLFGTHYYCDWELDLASDGTSTILQPGQSCSGADTSDPTMPVMYTWHGETFTLTTDDGRNGTLDASIPYDYTTLTGSGTCTMHFTGTMKKH